MTAPQPLALTLPLGEAETALSLASRLAALNGASRMLDFCTDMGMSWRQLAKGHPATVRTLALLADVDAEQLLHWTPQFQPDRSYRLGHTRAKFTAFLRKSMRVCSACIADDIRANGPLGAYHRGYWSVRALRSCLIHNQVLTPIQSIGENLDRYDFAMQIDGLANLPPAQTIKAGSLQTYLMQRLHGAKGPDWPDSLSFHVIAQSAEALGVLLINGADADRADLTEAEWIKAGQCGFDVFTGGPEALRQKLKSLQDTAWVGRSLHRQTYRVFFQWLRGRRHDESFAPVIDVVRSFIFDNFPIKLGTEILGGVCEEQKLHTIGTASLKFGITRERLGQALVYEGMAARRAQSKAAKIAAYLPELEVRRIVSDVKNAMLIHQATRFLGFERNLFAALVTRGLIPSYVGLHKNMLFRRANLEGFQRALYPKFPARRIPTEHRFGFRQLMPRLRCGFADLIELIVAGNIKTVDRDLDVLGLHGLALDIREVRVALAVPSDIGLSQMDCCDKLHLREGSTKPLVAAKLLELINVRRPITKKPIVVASATSIKKFDRNFISLARLAKEQGRAPGPLSQQLATADVYPVKITGLRSRIYLRDEVLTF